MVEILYDGDGQAVARVLDYRDGLPSEIEWDPRYDSDRIEDLRAQRDEPSEWAFDDDTNEWPPLDAYGPPPAEADPTGPSVEDEAWWAAETTRELALA